VAVPATLSISRARDFGQCRLLYRYRAVDRIPARPGVEAVRGTVVHRALDLLFELPPAERTGQAAPALLDQAWADVTAADPTVVFAVLPTADFPDARADAVPDAEQLTAAVARAQADVDAVRAGVDHLLAQAAALLDSYFTLEDPTRLQPQRREESVSVTLDSGLVLRGQIDRIEVAADGRTRVVDYKTGRPPGSGFESTALLQMHTYALILWRLSGRIPDLVRLLYLGDPMVLDDRPTAARLAIVEQRLDSVWQAIRGAAEAGQWPATRSRLCQWCAYRAACPEWGAPAIPLVDPVTGTGELLG